MDSHRFINWQFLPEDDSFESKQEAANGHLPLAAGLSKKSEYKDI